MTITKAISIVNQDGIEAGITATAGHGITIAAGAGDVVNLRGLTITGIGNNTGSGINVTSGSTLKIENCAISGFSQYGISIQVGGDTNFTITDTVASNNGLSGVYLFHSSGSLYGTLAQVTLVNNGNGLSLSSGVLASYEITLSNSMVSNNNNNGISELVGVFNLLILQSQLAGNVNGINVSSGSNIYLSQSYLFNNLDLNDTSCGGAFIESLQNNFYGTTCVCTKVTAATLH